MPIKTPTKKVRHQQKNEEFVYFWLSLSVIVAIIFGLSGLKVAFQSPYTIQDDARQYLFWMQQFQDDTVFQNDLIADYFKSVTPLGFTNLYRLVSSLGIDIFFFNKISTLIIGVTTTIYCFLVCLEIFTLPFAGFISSLLLNQNLWMVDDLSSGTPRAYIYLLLLAFIYYLLREKLKLCLLSIVLQGLFYPQAVLISLTILLLRILEKKQFKKIEFWGLCIGTIILVLYFLKSSDFAPVISLTEAKLLPEFLPGGRSAFFSDSFSQFWLRGRRSGFFPIEWQYSLMCVYGLGLYWFKKYPKQFPLVKGIKPQIKVLLKLLIASILLFFLAHLFLFRLHLPGRYTHHTIRIIIALLDGITITILFSKFYLWLKDKIGNLYFLKLVVFMFFIVLLLFPTYAVQSHPERFGYMTGKSELLYQFIQQQPSDTLIATISEEGDFIPSFTARSVLVAREYAIPYHQGYYQRFRQRVKDLIAAQYSFNEQEAIDFIQKYKVNFILIDNNAFTIDYLNNNPWLQQFQPQVNRAILALEDKEQTVIEKISGRCTIFKTNERILLDSSCILNDIKKIGTINRY